MQEILQNIYILLKYILDKLFPTYFTFNVNASIPFDNNEKNATTGKMTIMLKHKTNEPPPRISINIDTFQVTSSHAFSNLFFYHNNPLFFIIKSYTFLSASIKPFSRKEK